MRPLLLLLVTAHVAVSARDLRIGVFTLFHPSELVLRAVPENPLVIHIGDAEWKLDSSRTARFHLDSSAVLCTLDDRTISSPVVRMSGRHAAFILSVPGKIERRFAGALEIRARDHELVPILVTDLETAVASVAAAEAVHDAPAEALKAQAIAARSFYIASPARHPDFQFCDTTHCQFLREPPHDSAAALSTNGLVLLHAGAPLPALFSASCGGRTRTLAEAGMPVDGYPYYAVECRACQRNASFWRRSFPAGYSSLLEDHSEAHRIELDRIFGWNALPSSNYSTARDGDLILVRGRGEGHGIGLCQRGAHAMASSGADYRLILTYFYANTSLGSWKSPDGSGFRRR